MVFLKDDDGMSPVDWILNNSLNCSPVNSLNQTEEYKRWEKRQIDLGKKVPDETTREEKIEEYRKLLTSSVMKGGFTKGYVSKFIEKLNNG